MNPWMHAENMTKWRNKTTRKAEKTNQTVEGVLRTLINKKTHNNWALVLPLAEFAINSAPSASTQVSPFLATRGYQPRQGIASDWWDPPAEHREKQTFFQQMHSILTFICTEMEKAQVNVTPHLWERGGALTCKPDGTCNEERFAKGRLHENLSNHNK